MKSTGKIFLMFLGGAAAGAVAGLLLAPEKGKKTREMLSRRANDLRKNLEDTINTTISKTKDFNLF